MVKITISGDNIYEWPRSSRWLCHHCCHPFGDVPVVVPTWSGTCYHLRGNYCSWNCAKSDAVAQAKAGSFPKDATSLTLFAFQISFRGRHCPEKTRLHSPGCCCHSRFTGILPAPPKTALQAFGGSTTIAEFRRGNLVIEKYEWVQRFYSPRELTGAKCGYLYTLKPLRRVRVVDAEEDEDPVVLIKRRVY